jgi:hypothetical protein
MRPYFNCARKTMTRCVSLPAVLWLGVASTFPLICPSSLCAEDPPKRPEWTHAFDLSCRRLGEMEFTEKTRKFGVEVFKDLNTGYGLYLSQAGAWAAAAGFDKIRPPISNAKGPEWFAGLDLPCRKAGETSFSQSRIFSLEVFRDPNTDNWVYVTEKGALATSSSAGADPKPPADPKRPDWLHSVDLSVRKGGVKVWDGAKLYGLEIYRDSNTGNLVYLCETGNISVVPDKAPRASDGKKPAWLHGLDLSCRQHDEKDFTKKTRKFGVEVYRDENNGNLIYICETGHLAVLAAPKKTKAPTSNIQQPKWTHGLNLSCRASGEKEFTDRTRTFGAEVFLDPNTHVILYVAETGSITALPAK